LKEIKLLARDEQLFSETQFRHAFLPTINAFPFHASSLDQGWQQHVCWVIQRNQLPSLTT
jgi:hypothetical protein